MGHFRFHRSIGNKFFRLNMSKGGFSMTSGVPGIHLNTPLISRRKRRSMLTLGLPGSGLSYRQNVGGARGAQENGIPFLKQIIYVVIGLSVLAAFGVFK